MHQPTTQTTLPAALTPGELGAYMAQLRTEFGLTQQEVSERLHIRARYVRAMEEGRFDLMPGQVYARGYVHSYAEFLGLDAQQIVTQCFGETAVAVVHSPVAARHETRRSAPVRHWRGYGALAVVVLVGVLVVTQLLRPAAEETEKPVTVAPVPEEMLQTVRNLVMPTADNYACLSEDAALTCFYTDMLSRRMATLAHEDLLRWVGDIDLAIVAEEALLNARDEEAKKAEPVSDDAATPSSTDE